MLHGPWYSRANVFLTKYFFYFCLVAVSKMKLTKTKKVAKKIGLYIICTSSCTNIQKNLFFARCSVLTLLFDSSKLEMFCFLFFGIKF